MRSESISLFQKGITLICDLLSIIRYRNLDELGGEYLGERKMLRDEYREEFRKYVNEQVEHLSDPVVRLKEKIIENNISPDVLVNWHKSMLVELFPDTRLEILDSLDFLLNIMEEYRKVFREAQNLRHLQQELRTEIEIAANVQNTLLETTIPIIPQLEIGAISVPARYMNGDYYHFVQDENGCIGFGIADVIGKGIPAALCMSMIKYAMDSIHEDHHLPSGVLRALNRVVEQNVDDSMFISMFYGLYNPFTQKLTYSSAGHEPGIYYDAQKESFEELYAKGLLLGINKNTDYIQLEKQVQIGDMIILFSDGVTECRTEKGFIERSYLIECIKEHIDLHPQNIVLNVFKHLEELQHFQLRDDFTLVILKRKE